MEYPHWLMIAGAVLVAFGFVGLPIWSGDTRLSKAKLQMLCVRVRLTSWRSLILSTAS